MDIDQLLRYVLVQGLEDGTFAQDPFAAKRLLIETYRSFRAEMLFLPDQLNGETEDIINNLISNYNDLMVMLKESLSQQDKISLPRNNL